MNVERTTILHLSDGAACGLVWDEKSLAVVARVRAETAGPLPKGAKGIGLSMERTARHAAALAECARWVRLPASRPGIEPLCPRAAFIAGLTVADAFAIIHGALALSRVTDTATVHFSASEIEVESGVGALVLRDVVENPDLLLDA